MLFLAFLALLSLIELVKGLPADLGMVKAAGLLTGHFIVAWAGFESRPESFLARVAWFVGVVFLSLHYIPHIDFYAKAFDGLSVELRAPALWLIWFITPVLVLIAPFMQYQVDLSERWRAKVRSLAKGRRGSYWENS